MYLPIHVFKIHKIQIIVLIYLTFHSKSNGVLCVNNVLYACIPWSIYDYSYEELCSLDTIQSTFQYEISGESAKLKW